VVVSVIGVSSLGAGSLVNKFVCIGPPVLLFFFRLCVCVDVGL